MGAAGLRKLHGLGQPSGSNQLVSAQPPQLQHLRERTAGPIWLRASSPIPISCDETGRGPLCSRPSHGTSDEGVMISVERSATGTARPVRLNRLPRTIVRVSFVT